MQAGVFDYIDSGTSFAAPHVTGVAAIYLGANPTLTPGGLRNRLYAEVTIGAVRSAGWVRRID